MKNTDFCSREILCAKQPPIGFLLNQISFFRQKEGFESLVRPYHNFELEREYGEPNIKVVVKVNRLRWAVHLERIDPNEAPATLVAEMVAEELGSLKQNGSTASKRI